MDQLIVECLDEECSFTRTFEGPESYDSVAITVMMHHYNETKHDVQLRIANPTRVVARVGEAVSAIEAVRHG